MFFFFFWDHKRGWRRRAPKINARLEWRHEAATSDIDDNAGFDGGR